MAITFDPKKRVVRETTAPFEFVNDAGETERSDIRVRYFSRTVKDAKESQNRIKVLRDTEGENAVYWVTQDLVEVIESLPDLVDADGKPYPVTQEFLDDLTITNLQAIQDAVADDIAPKTTGAKP